MEHGGHDHGGHDMPMPEKCTMNMLWNTQIIDTCIVFRSWHISSNTVFVFSILAIVALGVFYEYLRSFQKALDYRIALALSKGKRKGRISGRSTPEDEEDAGLLSGRPFIAQAAPGYPVPPLQRVLRASVYGATVFLSFFLMLVFMTYNAYLIFAVVLGAALGHYVFGGTITLELDNGKGMACH